MEHAVIVHFEYGSTDLSRLFVLQSRLEDVLAETRAGELDGNEVAVDGSDGFLYLYGPDADLLYDAILPTLRSADFIKNAKVTLRYGPPEEGVRETVTAIKE